MMNRSNKSFNQVLTRLLGDARRPADGDMDGDITRVRERIGPHLQAESRRMPKGLITDTAVLPSRDRTMRRAWNLPFAAAAAVMFALALGILLWPSGSAAVVEAADNGLHRIVAGKLQPLRIGQKVETGQTIRSDGASSATLAFDDGSRLEMRSMSELEFEETRDGLRIQLNDGSVIVSAAKNGGKNLYVQTKDAKISLVDSVSLVTAEETSSHVAVIQGEAHVEQNGTLTKLGPGQHVATSLLVTSRPMAEEIAWSRRADFYMAMILQAVGPPTLQNQAPASSETFEVVSVRPNTSGSGAVSPIPGPRSSVPQGVRACAGLAPLTVQLTPGRVVMKNVSLYQLIIWAYGKHCALAQEHKLLVGPSWIETVGFDIQATLPSGFPSYTWQQMVGGEAPRLQLMLQNMLADRFKLTLHRALKEVPTYILTLPKMGIVRLSENQNPPAPAVASPTIGFPNPGTAPSRVLNIRYDPSQGIVTVHAASTPLPMMVGVIQGQLGRMIVDKTGITGLIDIPEQKFEIGNDAGPAWQAAWLPDILRKLGFNIESGRELVDALVIDRVEMPTEN